MSGISAGTLMSCFMIFPDKVLFTLNSLIKNCSHQYIARLDSDDVILPSRINVQVSYLQRHPSTAVVGCQGLAFRVSPLGFWVMMMPLLPNHSTSYINKGLNPLIHPSVMFNSSILGSHLRYSQEFKHVEDFELWSRLTYHGFSIANIASIGILYRIHSASVSSINSFTQSENLKLICTKYPIKTSAQPIKLNAYFHHAFRIVGYFLSLPFALFFFCAFFGVIFEGLILPRSFSVSSHFIPFL